MKKYFPYILTSLIGIFFAVQVLGSALSGTNVSAPIKPFDTNDTYPTHDARYGRGGYVQQPTTTARNAIPAFRRMTGMYVYVADQDKEYQLYNGTSNADWRERPAGSGSGHTIKDSAGNSKPARAFLRLSSPFHVTDDAGKNESRISLAADGFADYVMSVDGNNPTWRKPPQGATLLVASYYAAPRIADYYCDGDHDEVQIQAAIDAIKAGNRGGVVEFTEGGYSIEAKITLSSFYAGMRLKGRSASGMWGGAGTKFNLDYDGTMFEFTACDAVEISNIHFDGNARQYKILHYIDCSNASRIDCYFEECSPAIYAERAWDFWDTRCNFRDCGTGNSATNSAVVIYNGNTDNASGWKFTSCRWESRTGTSIYSDTSGSGGINNNISVIDGKFEAVVTDGYPAIYGNFFMLRTIGSYFYLTNSTSAFVDVTGDGNTINENTFLGGDYYGVIVNGNYNEVSNNRFLYPTTGITGLSHVRIAGGNGNNIVSNSMHGGVSASMLSSDASAMNTISFANTNSNNIVRNTITLIKRNNTNADFVLQSYSSATLTSSWDIAANAGRGAFTFYNTLTANTPLYVNGDSPHLSVTTNATGVGMGRFASDHNLEVQGAIKSFTSYIFPDGTTQATAASPFSGNGLRLTKVTSGTIYIEPTDSIIEVTTAGAVVNVGAVDKQATIISNASAGNITLQTSSVSPFPTLVGSPITLAAGQFVVIGEDPNNLNTNRVVLTGSNGGTGDHGGLTGLTDDDHSQYALLAGRSGTNDFTGNITLTGSMGIGGATTAKKLTVFGGTDNIGVNAEAGGAYYRDYDSGAPTAGQRIGNIALGATPDNGTTLYATAMIKAVAEPAWTFASERTTGMGLETTTTTTRAERLRVSGAGLTYFLNGGGLPSGNMYSNTATTITVASSGTWYEVDTGATDFTAGQLTGVTHSDHYLVVPVAGKYVISARGSAKSGAAGDEMAMSVMVNGTAQESCHGHTTAGSATTTENLGCETILSLSANDQVSLAVQNHTAARNITLGHMSLVLRHVAAQ